MWAKLRKLVSLKKLTQFVGVTFLLILCYVFWTKFTYESLTVKNKQLDSILQEKDKHICLDANRLVSKISSDSKAYVNSRTRQHALLFLQDESTQSGKQILYMLQAARFKYHAQFGAIRNLPALMDNNKGRYAVIIFEDISIYLQLNQWNKEILDKYCVEYDVGIVLFVLSEKKKSLNLVNNEQLGDMPLNYTSNLSLQNCDINPSSKILRILKAGERVRGRIQEGWSVFQPNHSTYEVITSAELNSDGDDSLQLQRLGEMRKKNAKMSSGWNWNIFRHGSNIFGAYGKKSQPPEELPENVYPTVLHDKGEYDQIEKVIFGNNLGFWLNKILFMDAVSYLSRGKLSLPLDRYMQIDIDDIFVSATGIRMHEDDVMQLIKFQKDMRKRVPGFNFLIGFSGKFYQKGSPEEAAGDAAFLRESHNFLWFPHMWSHMQAHLFHNKTTLCKYMRPNKLFAERHKFNVSSGYAVAPHHSGIYPVHEPLYDCWKEIWNIEATSTEEYPNLRPDTKRRGFIYKGIQVLPRQTCGLFTHTNYMNKYPGGKRKLDYSIRGGQLFQTFLLNRFNIYMTHFSNYGNDRLALYVFDRAIDFVQCWTNIRLLQVPPSDLAEKYFTEYPDEVDPIWTNPCQDPRHLEIWSKHKSCDRLPKFVIVGPQKTGTTALHWFLQMHPDLRSSKPSLLTFEEVQFFNTDNYLKGLDWYMDFFPQPDREEETIYFEKSANYFSSQLVPRRLSALLPKSHIIVLLVDPAKRAYSWYQHMRSHDDPTATRYTFYDVVKAKRKSSPSSLLALQARCLLPGRYAENIEHWNEYITSRQIILEDGELLSKNPVVVLKRLQKALGLANIFDFEKAIRFDEKKGFFCQIQESGKNKCLGKGKGRQYPEMSEKSRLYLEEYYREDNQRLLKILGNLKTPIPMWLSSYNLTVT